MSRFEALRIAAAAILAAGQLVAPALADEPAANPTAKIEYAQQGWSESDRDTFYTTSQGSHMMRYAWFKALRQPSSDAPFDADQLARYGYLPNESPRNGAGLPVGFVIEGSAETGQLGMTCAACHTGQLHYRTPDGAAHDLRVDGAPASANFQQLLTDLSASSRQTIADQARFDAFAKAVLGAGYSQAKAVGLKDAFAAWVDQFGAFMDHSLPTTQPWGPGRLDAFGMIFNRVAARDLDVEKNFTKADAPVSYPFLWNAPRQDRTQWPGTVQNGLYIQGLARNTGEVFGVFADFTPRNIPPFPHLIYYGANSADFAGLQTLEEKIATLQPPSWPSGLPLDEGLAHEGKALFAKNCGECHEQRASKDLVHAWDTPVRAVHTDPKMLTNAARIGKTGVYEGALLPPPTVGRFKDETTVVSILAGSVVGSLLDGAFIPRLDDGLLHKNGVWRAIVADFKDLAPGTDIKELHATNLLLIKKIQAALKDRLANLYQKPAKADPGPAYESRVLYGIWATAPYLHNGSVPNLWELLKPAKDRVPTFAVGNRFVFDPVAVGLATDQSPFATGTFATDPANQNGNGNGGHEYGVGLSEHERWAIIEYLKTAKEGEAP